MAETTIASFIVRFTQEKPSPKALATEGWQPGWRGIVRHVQSSEQMRFTRIEEALRFMSGYVALESDLNLRIQDVTAVDGDNP